MKKDFKLNDVKNVFEQMIIATKDKETLTVLISMYKILKAKLKDKKDKHN